MRRRPLLILVVLLLLGALAAFFARRNGESAVEVTVGAAARQAVFRSMVTASGEIVATRYADIGSSIMGKIVALPVKEGDRVRAGQMLARIDPVQARAEVAAAEAQAQAQSADATGAERQIRTAEAELQLAEARLREAELTLGRAKELFGQGLAPRADLDTAQAAADSTRAQVASARASVDRVGSALTAARQRASQARAQTTRSRDVLSKTEITAPIDGVVSRLQVREGEMVVIGIQNQPGTTLMTISDLSAINAEVKVAEADVLRLQVGQTATVDLEAIPGRSFAGRVVEVGASALPVVGTAAAAREFRVVIRLDEADPALRPGLTCDAEILVSERTGVLTVPLQAVVLRDRPAPTSSRAEQSGVFVVEGERVRFVPVKTGIIGGLAIEVDGVQEGTSIVTGPFQALRQLQDGGRIKMRRPERAPAAR